MKIIKHFITITRHRLKVMMFCFKCGLIWQGLTHDLSKYSFVEFFRSAKYYTGKRSPIYFEREALGYSKAWLHHKGRNKHHVEYWIDMSNETRIYNPIVMPKRYIVESFCDRLSATKTYNKKQFEPIMVKQYFEKEKNTLPMREKTKECLEFLINYYVENGEKKTFLFIRKEFLKKEFK